MTAPDHDRVAELFRAASRLAGDARAAYLDDACGGDAALRAEVESLLEHDASDGLERAARAAAADLRELERAATPASYPDRIGSYAVRGVIGAGGMGVVYEAEQDSPSRQVALKVVRPGMATDGLLRRFEHEAQVLGWLDHPGIARIYEAGTADTGHGPQPFFAMELVRGEPIHEFAQRADLGVRERLELVAKVAEAVHHAHQKGVVHRDLKPANVLVGADGQPKVLDFGVARVTDADLELTTALTQAGELVGTLPYMSPEQVAGDPAAVDARSDVYSLGALTYELLSGELPHDVRALPLPEAARRIAEEEPTTLGARDRRLRGDVEIIVGKALQAEKERRYRSADELAADIRRHLADEAILARPPSGTYQLMKFARRNRALVAGVALAFVALLVGAVVSTAQYLDARAGWDAERLQRQAAEENAAAADRVTEFLVDLFEVPDTSVDWGQDVTARELLDRGVRDIAAGLEDQPRIRARLMGTMGRVYGNLGLYEQARPLLEQALAQQRAAGDDERAAQTLRSLGNVERLAGEYADGAAALREARELLLALGGEEHPGYAQVLTGLGGVEVLLGEYASAQAHLERAIELLDARHGPDSLEASFPRASLAQLHARCDRLDEALALAEEVHATRGALLDEEDPDRIAAMQTLALVKYERGDDPGYLELSRAIHDVVTRRLDEDHPQYLGAQHELALALQEAGELQEAERLLLDHLEKARELYGARNPRTAAALHSVGAVQYDLGEHAEAEAHLREALAIREEVMGPEHLDVASTLSVYAALLNYGMRRPQDAIPLYERALAIARAHLGDEQRATVANLLSGLATAHAYTGQYDMAEESFADLVDVYRDMLGPHNEEIAQTLHGLSILRKNAGDIEGALDYAHQVREVHDAILPPGHPDRAFPLDVIARCYIDTDRHAEAETVLHEALTIRRAGLPEDNVHIAESESLLALCLIEREAFEEAEPLLLHALETCRKTYPPGHPQEQFILARVQNLYRHWGKLEEAERYLKLYRGAGGR